MSPGWAAILPETDGDPVRGRPDEFQNAAERFRQVHDKASEVAQEFRDICSGASVDQFAGDAAEAFRQVIAQVNHAVQHLPGVASGVAATFASHAHELEILRRRCDEALARAQTHWRSLGSAQSDLNAARSRRSTILSQIDALETAAGGAPEIQVQLDNSRRDLDRVDRTVDAAKRAVRSADGGLHDARLDWRNLRADETVLDDRTAQALIRQELWSLGDPSTIEQGAAWIGDGLKALYDFSLGAVIESLQNAYALIVKGEWLMALREVLDAVLTILWIVGLFIPGLALAVLALSVAKLLVDSLLFAQGKIEPLDLVMSFVGVGTAFIGFKGDAAATAARKLASSGKVVSVFEPVARQATRLQRIDKVLTYGEKAIDSTEALVDIRMDTSRPTRIDPVRLLFLPRAMPRAIEVCSGPEPAAIQAGFVRVIPSGAGW